MINIPAPKCHYYNKRSVELLEYIEEIVPIKKEVKEYNERTCIPVQKIENIISSPREFSFSESNEIIKVIEHANETDYIINEHNINEFSKCINDIHNIKDIRATVSKSFIRTKTLDWFFTVKKEKQIQCEFMQYIVDQINNVVKSYTVYFPMSHLYTQKTIKLAMVKIEPIPVDQLEQILPKDTGGKLYKNKAFVSTTILGEKEYAADIAYRFCSLAVDILKICSKLTFEPNNYGYCLDIDRNIQTPSHYRYFIQDAQNKEFVSSNFKVEIHDCEIDDEYWKFLIEHDLPLFESFLSNIQNKETELKKIIIASIQNLSEALSIRDKYKRVVQLCSILDTIALKDTEVGIKESIRKYIPILVAPIGNKRKIAQDIISKMYDIRSQYIHHAKKNPFTERDLYALHWTVFLLIRRMIIETNNHNSMKEILQEIEDKFMSIE